MENHLLFRTNKLLIKVLCTGIVFLFLTGVGTLTAQVTFTQTLNADFNKGVLNNAVVSGDNISLQYSASDVGSWLTTTVLPQTLAGHRTVSWNDRYVYMVGGYNDLIYVNTVYVATIQSGGITGWTTLNPLPVALRDPAVVIGTNTIYVMGGRDGSQVYNTIYYAALNTDGTIGAWQTSAVTLPANLWGHTATYLMGYIYVTGGTSSLTETTALSNVYFTKVNALNTLSAFSAGTSLPAARNRHSAVTYNSKLFVMGGYDNSGTKASTVYIATPGLNGTTGAWSAGTSLPVAVSNHSSAVTNGVISVMAGAVGATLSNTVYYANADAGALVWNTSGNVMYDFTKDGSAFTGNGMVFYSGGINLSGTPIYNCRYALMTLTANYINHGVFVSNPFYELGAERLINQIAFNKTATPPALVQVNYRTAGSNGVWSDWTALTGTSPILIGLTRQYLQYAVALTGSTTFNATLLDMSLMTPGTQLSGNLNGTATFTAALSPYWATSDISFTAGTHTFQAGTSILFLPGTGLTVDQANVICNGTVADSVKFTYFTNETGQWDGIYFNESSDIGVSSQFYYTAIVGAGFGTNNANLYCYQTSEPLLSHCCIRYADGNGIRLNSAPMNIQNSAIKGNAENGLYLNTSNPTLISSTLSYNGGAGVYFTSTASVPNFSSGTVTIDHNMYALRYPSPEFTFYQPNGSPVLSLNMYNGLCIDGGLMYSSQHWNTITYDYILLGTVQFGTYAGACRLTIEPGNTIKFLPGVQLQVGIASSYGGELYALGTVDSVITFTPYNGLAGGWGGIWFTDWSDNWGGQSQLDYCVIEKGNDYNYYSLSTSQPNLINHTIIRDAVTDGARYSSSTGNITNCQFTNNGRYPLFFVDPQANPAHTSNTFTGNVINRIAVSGGGYSFNRTLNLDGALYYVLADMTFAAYGSTCRLTIDPGVTVEFAAGTKLQFGYPSSYGGELWAVGTSGSQIVLRPYNLTAGGWEGIYFTSWNDNWGGISKMEYCKVRQGNAQNILIEGSTQPTINYCNIRESAGVGISLYQSSCPITNTIFTLNGSYPLKFTDWSCNSYLRNNTYTSNNPNYIYLSGGYYEDNRTVYFDGAPYFVANDIFMALYAWHSRLIVQPGVTMAFGEGVKLQLGYPNSYGGDLWAEGKADSIIYFKPYNNTAGGWAGINFTDWNDQWSGSSLLKYCSVEKGASYNINCTNSGQPALDHCTLIQSTGNGLNTDNSGITITNSTFQYNTGYGIYINGNAVPVIGNTSPYTCNILNNYGAYDLYNNSSSNVNARYNFWGAGDSALVGQRIYDKSDNSSKGRVYIGPFAQVQALATANTVMSGWIKYANPGSNPMKNAAMVVKDFTGTTVNSTTTNTSGIYALPSMPSGNYRLTITPSNPWGGSNGTDALNILRHFAQIELLTGIKLAAADVNVSHTVNSTDALLVMERWSAMISSFPAGDYLYDYDTVIVSGSNVTGNIKMLCFGDVDASYAPAKTANSTGLVLEGSVVVGSFQEFDFPVRLKTAMQAGAISLGFYYPQEFLEIQGVSLANGVTGFAWSAADGLFRMSWCDLNPLNVNGDEVVVVIKMKTRDLTTLSEGIALGLYPESEFADGSAVTNGSAVVSIPVINTILTGINPGEGVTGLTVFPNPVNGNSVLAFSLDKPGKVSIALYSITGTRIKDIVTQSFLAGYHRIGLETTGLEPGVYLLKTEYTINGQPASGMIKVVVSR